jgi:UBX domain-containing protein 2
MLLILVGDTYDTDTDTVDVNSKLLLEKILLNKKTLQYLRKIDNDLIIYLKCVHELEPWLVARQLGVRNTPEIFLIANVANKASHSETLPSQRLSILGKLKVNSLNRFLQSLTNVVEKYTPELVVNKTEMHELRMSREIKKLQEDAYKKSLEMDRIKAIEKEKSLKHAQDLKLNSTARQLKWLKACIDEIQPFETTGKQATLQFRTSSGKRFVKKFPSMTTLYQIYQSIGCHIYLAVYSSDPVEWSNALQDKIRQLSADDDVLCFKEGQLETATATTIEELGHIINNELTSFDLERGKLEFDFELVSPFPKYTVHPNEHMSVDQVPQLWPNGSLLVEALDEEDEEDEENEEQ